MKITDILKRTFTWWHSATWPTVFTLFRYKAREVGQDCQGNRYFEEGGKGSQPDGAGPRRWVIYHGVAEASRVPPEWQGWLTFIYDLPPSQQTLPVKKFEKPYLPNMTGTPMAYRPKGSLSRLGEAATGGERAKVKESYEAWSPDDL